MSQTCAYPSVEKAQWDFILRLHQPVIPSVSLTFNTDTFFLLHSFEL